MKKFWPPPERTLGLTAHAVRRSAAFGIAALALFIAIGVYLAPLKPNILWLQFAFTEAAFQGVLSKWQASGVALYRSHLPADFVLLCLYGAFGFAYGTQFVASHATARTAAAIFVWSLPVAAAADTTENILHLLLTGSQPVAAHVLYSISGFAASVKWLAILVFAASALAARRESAG